MIPAVNEARNLPGLLMGIPSWVTEILLVDGGSTDDTIAVATHACPGIQVIRQPGTGKGDALRAGFEAASGDILVTIDADGSMRPDEMRAYVEALLLGYDLVKGSRFVPGGNSTDLTLFRRLGNHCLVWLVRLLLGGSYTDLNYGYSAFWRELLPLFRLANEPPQLGFEIESLIGVRALVNRLRVAEIASVEVERVHGASRLHPLRDGWRVLTTIVREARAWHLLALAGGSRTVEKTERGVFVTSDRSEMRMDEAVFRVRIAELERQGLSDRVLKLHRIAEVTAGGARGFPMIGWAGRLKALGRTWRRRLVRVRRALLRTPA